MAQQGTQATGGQVVSLDAPTRKSDSLWMDAIKRLLRNRAALMGIIIIAVMFLMAIFADFLMPTITVTVTGRDAEGKWLYVEDNQHQGVTGWAEARLVKEMQPVTAAPVDRVSMPFQAELIHPTDLLEAPEEGAAPVLADFDGEIIVRGEDETGTWLKLGVLVTGWARGETMEFSEEEADQATLPGAALYEAPELTAPAVLETYQGGVTILERAEGGEWFQVQTNSTTEAWVQEPLVKLSFRRDHVAEVLLPTRLYGEPGEPDTRLMDDFAGKVEVLGKDYADEWRFVRTEEGTEAWMPANASIFPFDEVQNARVFQPVPLYRESLEDAETVTEAIQGEVSVIGQESGGDWLFVRTSDNVEGWVETPQVVFILPEPRPVEVMLEAPLYTVPGERDAQIMEAFTGKLSMLGHSGDGDWLMTETSEGDEAWVSSEVTRLPIESEVVEVTRTISIYAEPSRGAEELQYLAPRDFESQILEYENAAPEWITVLFPTMVPESQGGYIKLNNDYPLGTDHLGRDLLARIIYGARISLAVAIVGPTVALLVGILFGVTSGYFGGRVDNVMMRVVDIMYAFPTILLIILMMAFFRSSFVESEPGTLAYTLSEIDSSMGGMFFIFIGIGLTAWMGMARLTRGQVLSVREKEFVEAARSIGQGTGGIMFRHILPNILGPLIVAETLAIPTYISYEAFLSFIGLGVNRPTPSWGAMISDGAQALRSYPNQAVFPALALAVIMFAFNFLGDGLRDALDPRMRGVD